MSKKRKTKSPLKSPPRRLPGQSIDEEIKKLLDDYAYPYLIVGVFTTVLAIMEWWKWWTDAPPQPVLLTIIAVIAVTVGFFKLLKIRRQIRSLKLGRDGERAVGQFLDDKLPSMGYRVFHDLVGGEFNVDHVVVGPAGIFTIETKTISKPMKGETVVRYDGEKITVGGFTPDRDPLVQGKAQAAWIRGLVAEATGQRYDVRPVVLYPGWFVDTPKGKWFNVLVMHPQGLEGFLKKSPAKLGDDEVRKIAFNLSRQVRVGNAG